MSILPSIEETGHRFGAIAQTFCDVVDSAPDLDRVDLLVRVYRILPRLISEAISLPDVELGHDEGQEEERRKSIILATSQLNDARWGQLYSLLKEKLGDWNLYWQVWDPRKDNEAIHGSLADDIADIYRDLKEGLIRIEAHQSPLGDIIWDWRIAFYSHWGKHAIDAMRTIHFLLEGILG